MQLQLRVKVMVAERRSSNKRTNKCLIKLTNITIAKKNASITSAKNVGSAEYLHFKVELIDYYTPLRIPLLMEDLLINRLSAWCRWLMSFNKPTTFLSFLSFTFRRITMSFSWLIQHLINWILYLFYSELNWIEFYLKYQSELNYNSLIKNQHFHLSHFSSHMDQDKASGQTNKSQKNQPFKSSAQQFNPG